jgi:hypothetical protein
VVHANEPSHLDRRADFLHAFARGCGRRVLVVIDEPARQTPEAVTRFDRAAAQHDSAVNLNDNRGGDLRVVPEDE